MKKMITVTLKEKEIINVHELSIDELEILLDEKNIEYEIDMSKEELIKLLNTDFIEIYKHEQKLPASITNYSMALGERMGLIESSQMTDLKEVQKIFEIALNPGQNTDDLTNGLDVNKYLKIIYLSIMGVNPNLDLTFDDFTKLYHEDIPTIIDTFTDLVLGTMNIDENGFAKELHASVKKLVKTN